jgi:hypothetical protein
MPGLYEPYWLATTRCETDSEKPFNRSLTLVFKLLCTLSLSEHVQVVFHLLLLISHVSDWVLVGCAGTDWDRLFYLISASRVHWWFAAKVDLLSRARVILEVGEYSAPILIRSGSLVW